MKRFHFPTLLLHILLLLLARLTLGDYPDFFLGAAIPLLVIHAVWAACSADDFLPAHCMGLCLYTLSQTFGLLPDSLGGGFAWFFYGIALAVSFAVLSIIRIVRWFRAR